MSINGSRRIGKHILNSEVLCPRNRMRCCSVTLFHVGFSSKIRVGLESLSQWFPNFNMHQNHLGVFVIQCLWWDPTIARSCCFCGSRVHILSSTVLGDHGNLSGVIPFNVFLFHFNVPHVFPAPSICKVLCLGPKDGGGKGNEEQ